MTPATSGLGSTKPFAHYDPDSSSWRTSPATDPRASEPFSATWPKAGMTCDGRAYELPTWVPVIAESGCSSLQPLPTPTANCSTGPGRQGREGGMNLQSAIQLLPTPTVTDMGARKTVKEWDAWTAAMQERHGNGNGHGKSLSIEVKKMLLTPTVNDSRSGRNATAGRSNPDSKHHSGTTLSDWAMLRSEDHLLPTPTARDHKEGPNFTPHPEKIKLTHTIAHLFRPGANTEPPSSDGNESSDVPPPTP